MIKQVMATVNIDTLGISKLKWTGMGEFNSDDYYILLRAGIPQKKWSSHHGQQKSLKCSTWMQSQKQQNDLFVSKANHSVSQLSKSILQPVMLKKLKLNGFMKTYKTF